MNKVSADIRLLATLRLGQRRRTEKEIDISRIYFELSRKKLESTNYETDYRLIRNSNTYTCNRSIICLIIIVNIIFSGYFKYYFTYGHLFFTVRSPCHMALPDPKSS